MFVPIPPHDPKWTSQRELTEMSLEEFTKVMSVPQQGIFIKLIKLIVFILIGIIKFTIFTMGTGLTVVVVFFVALLKPLAKNDVKYLLFGQRCISYPLRLLLFGCGVMKINVIGKCDSQARFMVSNHISAVDPFVFGICKQCTFIAAEELKKVWFIKTIGKAVNIFFFDRHKPAGFSEQLNQYAENKEYEQILIYPEGEVTSGNLLLRFRSGAFINDFVIQPVTLTFKCWFVTKGYSTVSWVDMNLFRHYYDFFIIPWITIDLEFLPKYEGKGKSAAQRAQEVQIQMANHLGIPAITLTNTDFYTKVKGRKAL